MNLLVIRHARAESAKRFAQTCADDDLRPLTADGAERMRLGAAGLHRLVPDLDLLATSPQVRARQTADIVAAEYGLSNLVVLDELRSGRPPAEFIDWLQETGARETIAIVGHDSHVSDLVSALLTGKKRNIVEIKKGAAVMLELRRRDGRYGGPRSARLLWALAPRHLRLLGTAD